MKMAPTLARVEKTLVRPAFWFCACNLLAATLAAQCSNPTQVPNQTDNSGSYNYSDNNALSASNVVVNGSASMTFIAGNCIQLLPGFHATAGTAAITFHALVEAKPSAVSVSPSGGTGLSQAFTWTVSSLSGYSNLSDIYTLFNTSISGVNACYIHYNRASNLLYLDNASATAWSSGIVPGSGGTTGAWNPYCTLNGTGSGVTTLGTQLSLTVSITFQTSFAGAKNDYLIAYDNEGLNSTWQQMGTWTVGSSGGTVATPTMNPAPGNYPTAQTVSLSTATSGASIRYTTDGSTPSETLGTAYASPFVVSATATIKAIGYLAG